MTEKTKRVEVEKTHARPIPERKNVVKTASVLWPSRDKRTVRTGTPK